MLPAAADPAARAVQIEERAFWMQRDLNQTAHNRVLCAEKEELAGLIRANNEGAGDPR